MILVSFDNSNTTYVIGILNQIDGYHLQTRRSFIEQILQ